MKNIRKIVVFQMLLAMISGLLISKMPLLGKVGIALFFKEYQIFRFFWQTGLLFFVIQIVLLCILLLIHRISKRITNFYIIPLCWCLWVCELPFMISKPKPHTTY